MKKMETGIPINNEIVDDLPISDELKKESEDRAENEKAESIPTLPEYPGYYWVDNILMVKQKPDDVNVVKESKNPILNRINFVFNSLAEQNQRYMKPDQLFLPENDPLNRSHRFLYPDYYFQVSKNKLRILGSDIEIDMEQEEFSYYLLDDLERLLGKPWKRKEIFDLIYQRLRHNSRFYTGYYKALLEFKWRARLIQFPMFDHFNCVFCRDDWLLTYTNDSKEMILSEEYVHSEIARWGGNPDIDKDIEMNLANELLKLHNLTNTPKKATAQEQDPSAGVYSIVFSFGILEYNEIIGSSVFTANALYQTPALLEPSEQLVDYLYALVGDDTAKLDLISELIARLLCSKLPSKYIWNVYGETNLPQDIALTKFIRLLFSLVNQNHSYALFESNMDNLISLLKNDFYSKPPIQMPYKPIDVSKSNSLYHLHLVDYLNGKQLEFRDYYQIDHSIVYRPVILFPPFDLSQTPVSSYAKYVKGIMIPKESSHVGSFSYEDLFWISTCFASYGISIICNQKSVKETNESAFIWGFLNNYCKAIDDEKHSVKALDLFNAYCRYADAVLGQSVFPKHRNQFYKEVQKLKMWKIDTVRSQGNSKAFIKVEMDNERLMSDIEKLDKAQQTKKQSGKEAFKEKLLGISKMVVFKQIA